MQTFISEKYTIQKGCDMFTDSTQEVDVKWSKIVLKRLSVPKHIFVMWLMMQGRLRTKDNLGKIGGIDNSLCFLCGNKDESAHHLFFECEYSYRCLQGVMNWMEWKARGVSIEDLTSWVKKLMSVRCSTGFFMLS